MSRRLVLAMTALVAAVALALAIPLSVIVDNDQRAAFVSGLEVDALGTASLLSSQPAASWPSTVDEVAARTGARVVVVGADRALAADSDRTALDRSFDRIEIDEALAGNLASDVRFSTTLGHDLRYVAAPVIQQERIVAAVRLSLPDEEVEALVTRTRLALLGFVVAVVVAAAMVAWIVAYSIAAPLRRVAVAAEELSDDLSVRAPEGVGPAEVRSVSRALNRTAERLSGLLRRQERVAADASHHLRTPLTGVRLRLEAIADTSDDEETRAEASAALREVDRLDRRIEQVLALARSDAGQPAVRIAVDTVVRDRIAAAAAAAAERGIVIECEPARDGGPASGAVILAPLGSLDRVLDELLGNALAYARSRIRVAIGRDGAMTTPVVTVSVADDGPGVSAADRQRIFERFVRGGTAVPGGSGLGLALVRETARAAGGEARAQEAGAGGLEIVTEWPSAP